MKNNNPKIKKIKLIVSDVDGVLTDGRILISSNSEESKFFHVEDGTAAALAYYANLPIALISGRYSKSTEIRAQELKIEHCYQGVLNKKFILVSQKRVPINKNNYEFPSGWIDKDEKPVQSASRELLEETGFKSIIQPKKLITLYPDPGRLSNKMTCYYTDQITKVDLPEKGIGILISRQS